eukprot:scaffold17229_cov20-Tisochrysis_lutea.AAC.2
MGTGNKSRMKLRRGFNQASSSEAPSLAPAHQQNTTPVSASGTLNQASSFETPSRAMAISNDSIFRAADNIIEVCNTTGRCLSHLHGHIHVTPSYLTCMAMLILCPATSPAWPGFYYAQLPHLHGQASIAARY